MAEVNNTVEHYVSKQNMSILMGGIKTAIDSGGGGGGGGGSDPDGTTVINRDSSGEVISMVFTYSGGVTTTTFAETATTKYIVSSDVKTGSSIATVRTTAITGDTITTSTRTEPIE